MSDLTPSDLRTLMGRALHSLRGDFAEVHPGWWAWFSGSNGADANMALIQDEDERALEHVIDVVRTRNLPVLLMLAGDGARLGEKLPDGWTGVGSMPIMSVDIGGNSGSLDARVRQATFEDTDTVIQLIADAYGLDWDVSAAFVRSVLDTPGEVMRYWILEEAGLPVSTVMSGRVGETLSIWAMSTPPEHARRGYARALLGSVIDWAKKDGATIGLLGATEPGFPLYESTGWTTFEQWQLYVNAPSAQFAH